MAVLKCKTPINFIGVVLITCFVLITPTSAQQNSAQITIETLSNSSATRGKNYLVSYFADEDCSKRGKSSKIYEKKYADSTHTFNPLSVELDQAFIFQVAYLEKRRGETRRCTAIANVELQPRHNYKAVFSVVDEVVGCHIEIFDLTPTESVVNEEGQKNQNILTGEAPTAEQPSSSKVVSPNVVEHKKPAKTCARIGEKGYGNGTPVYTYKDRLG